MVYAGIIVWILNKDDGNEPMNGKPFCPSVFAQSNSPIAIFCIFLAEWFWTPSVVKVNADYISKVAYPIEPLVSWYVHPVLNFFHKLKDCPKRSAVERALAY